MLNNINEKEVKAIDKEITPIIKKSESLKIKTSDDLEKATIILSDINRYKDSVKKKKEEITKPINAGLKAIRQIFAPLEERLENAVNTIRSEMIEYKKIADAEKAKIADRIGEGKGKLKIETAIKKIDDIKTDVSTESGSIKFRTVKKFKVVDISKLPIECLLPNETKIRSLMNANVEVPGVEYYTEDVPMNKR